MGKGKSKAFVAAVQWKNIGVGSDTVRLGFSLARARGDDLAAIEEMFCNSQVQAVIAIKQNEPPGGDDPRQEKLDGVAELQMDIIADIKGFRVTSDAIGAALTINAAEIDIAQLCHFANRAGALECTRVGDASTKESAEE